MKILRERITGDLATPFQKVTDYTYSFKIPDTDYNYIVTFDQSSYDEIDVVFKLYNKDHKKGTHNQVDVGMRGAAIVFHTVWAILRTFLENSLDPISWVTFAAKEAETSRVKFYATLAKELALHYNQDPSDIETRRIETTESTIEYRVPVFIEGRV